MKPQPQQHHHNYLCEWQRRWEDEQKAAWTRTLIPNISRWARRKHGELEFHLIQALTGHECFAAFLHRIGREQDDRCCYCGDKDDVEHTLFLCEAWDRERLALMRKIMYWPSKENFETRCCGPKRTGMLPPPL
jgi:hypothetical protein